MEAVCQDGGPRRLTSAVSDTGTAAALGALCASVAVQSSSS